MSTRLHIVIAVSFMLLGTFAGGWHGPCFAQTSAKKVDPGIVAAKAFFDKYVKLEREFDPAQASLYAPNARIVLRRGAREATLTGTQMQELIQKTMPLAKLKSDTNTYSNTTYTRDGKYIRIKTARMANLTGINTPHEIVLASPNEKDWYIVQETVESGH